MFVSGAPRDEVNDMNKASRILTIGLLAVMSVCVGCAEKSKTVAAAKNQDNPTPNDTLCVVHFKRNYLGIARDTPISLTTGNFNGADITVAGKLKKVTDEWIVVETTDSEKWIPREVILYLQK